jgi:hypothetical protein
MHGAEFMSQTLARIEHGSMDFEKNSLANCDAPPQRNEAIV